MARLSTRLLHFFLLLWIAITLSHSNEAQAMDPSLQWEQIETPHFIIVYDSKHHQLAELYARYAEQAFAVTSPAFGIWPDKTVVLLNDDVDMANGFATGVPYSMVSLFPVLPTSLDSISDYGNWGLELITHEYTHILTFAPATGWLMSPLRSIFGTIVRPNILLPKWYLEGLATEMETRHSDFGRLRSANYLSIPRAMVEEGTLRKEDISRINEVSIPDWPGGIRPYLMGALLWNELTRMKGDPIIGDLNLAYSRRIPFFINGPVEDRVGLDYSEILTKVYDRTETNARSQLSLIEAAGASKGEKFKQAGFFTHTPAVSPDGKKLIFLGKTHNVDSFVTLIVRSDATRTFRGWKSRTLLEGTGINRASWLPTSDAFIYDNIDTFDRYYQFSDLWRYDLKQRKKTQLTHGLRAREPAVSPNGQFVAFVRNLPGNTTLSIAKIDGSEPIDLLNPPIQTRISRPEFIDDTTLVYTEKHDNGSEALMRLTLDVPSDGRVAANASPIELLPAFKPIHFPRMTKEGLLFVSDRSGVANVYLANASLDDARAVTNTTTRAITGELDQSTGELIYSRLTSDGPQLYSSPRSEWNKVPTDPPQVGPLVDYQWPTHHTPEVEVPIERKPYSALPHLLPRYWMPMLFAIPEGLYFSATTATSDPVGRHAYSLSAGFDTLTDRPSLFGQYINRTTDVTYSVLGEDSWDYIYSGGIRRHSTAGALAGSFFLPGLNEDWRGSLGWQYFQSDIENDILVRNGPQVSLSWSNVSQRGLQISPEKGGSFSIAHTQYLPKLGTLDYGQTDVSAAYYFSRWLPERHALGFFTSASIAPGLDRALLGKTTVGGTYQTGVATRSLIMRGYGSGVFIGRNMITGTAEYRFPLHYSYEGFGTTPFFIQRWHGDVFVDGLTLDGLSYDFDAKTFRREKLGTYFVGTGAEVKMDATVFYHVPVQFIFGLYYGATKSANPNGLFPFIGLGL